MRAEIRAGEMHVRSRLHHRRLQISLIDTRRVDGKVRQEHLASLGSVAVQAGEGVVVRGSGAQNGRL